MEEGGGRSACLRFGDLSFGKSLSVCPSSTDLSLGVTVNCFNLFYIAVPISEGTERKAKREAECL